ncbi:MAG: pyridoxamine 5'-phosphate oxidase family protein [Acidimicrobiales bacterium]|nr:pyridoxamine 5'-phosphate oxidase family protein [Acidimicrobiales bacterium]
MLDAGMIAHVGVQTPDGPLVLPMAYGRDDDTLYLHGAAANHLLGNRVGGVVARG